MLYRLGGKWPPEAAKAVFPIMTLIVMCLYIPAQVYGQRNEVSRWQSTVVMGKGGVGEFRIRDLVFAPVNSRARTIETLFSGLLQPKSKFCNVTQQ